MAPLDLDRLPKALADIYAGDQMFRDYLALWSRVSRAEKISCWSQWTTEQAAAYKAGDTLKFSRLRGYSEEEIEEFSQYIGRVHEVDAKYGEGFCASIEFSLAGLVSTPELDTIERAIFDMSEAALESAKSRNSN